MLLIINVYLIGQINKTKMKKKKSSLLYMLPYLAKSLPWLSEVLVSFALFPLVFILREAKRTSGGTRYKSQFHAELQFENLQNRLYILWRVILRSSVVKSFVYLKSFSPPMTIDNREFKLRVIRQTVSGNKE